ncbi:hypothetical protein VTL71DRAFT_2679 [Oculimacula yallundae]|uniref:EDC4-like protein pdc1 beta-propeller domain-containing protein n=1 Tax=Oculimacula yallundae TaxID=86028 RepID=A0ABR4CBU4_9HELO
MSGYPAGAGDGPGLDALLASLRFANPQSSRPLQPAQPQLEPSYSYYGNDNGNYFGQPGPSQIQQGYEQPSVSSPLPTPPVGGPPPHHASAVISPVDTPHQRVPAAAGTPSNADRTSSLLNLLKFSQASGGSSSQPAPIGTPLPPSRQGSAAYASPEFQGPASASSHGRGGSDLLAALMGTAQPRPVQQASPQFTPSLQPHQSTFKPASPSADTQAYLLSLLNQPKPAQSSNTPQMKPAKVLTPPSKAASQEDDDELAQDYETVHLQNSMMGSAATEGLPSMGKENTREPAPKAQGLFTYVNPFDQLSASSPRNRTPKMESAGPASAASPKIQILKRQEPSESKRKADSPHTKRKAVPSSQSSSAPPTPLPDGRTQVEALIGIGASDNKESVHAALSEVGGQADKQVQEAISRAETAESHAAIERDLRDLLAATTEKEFEASAQQAAVSIKEELEKSENSGALDSLPTPLAEEIKDIIDETAHGHIADSWESADAEESPSKEEENIVKVFNFPMKPWSLITIKESEEIRPVFRDEAVMDIARLKKEFDQIDRTLVTASNNFIVYGMSKNGGIRIIRQDDGKDARLFTETHDRIFSVVTSASSVEQKESIIGTGISGTVYWALVKDGEGDHLEESNIEMYGFALPPIQSSDTESPGGVLKTRARKSSGHPDFFAVGRGKFIHVIWPSVITKQSLLKNGKDRIVDTDKYLSKHSLKVNTGKAGKDFTFSEDDTIIVSLDKAGRVKFWDVRSLTSADIATHPSRNQQIEIKEPLITFTTTPASEKSWPTSVLFVDKLRPYQRGGALRYLIVGMKQNHILQLWDLALGKPVQEIHLPHSKESDAVCSVLYHAATGMIVVGHPTRNSIYFLHLSAPKYNLPKSITQAEFIEKLVANDPSIPKPESTAVISGMREYSFANKGSLRSLDILQTPNSTTNSSDPSTLFELYAMHSKGVTCLNIKQADLGWTSDNKVIHPVEALPTGAISIETLKDISPAPAAEVTESSAPYPLPTRIVPRPAPKETSAKDSPKKNHQGESSAPASKGEAKSDKKDHGANGGPATPVVSEKAERKKRRKATTESSAELGPVGQSSKPIVLDPSSHARNGNLSKATASTTTPAEASGTTNTPQDFSEASLQNIETRISGEVKKLFNDSLASLHNELKDDRRTQAAVGEAKQDAMLRLVSSTLGDNMETTLGRKVSDGLQKSVIPSVVDACQKAVKEQLGSTLNAHLAQNLPKELQKSLPDVVGRALQQPQLLKLMSESLAKSVAFRVEEHFAVLVQNVVTPSFHNLVAQSTQRIATEIHRQTAEQLNTIELQRRADTIKIEQLTQLVTGLTHTISSMAEAQTHFQAQFLKVQEQAADDRRQLALQSSSQQGASQQFSSQHGASQRGEGSVGTTRASMSRSSTAQEPVVEKTQLEKEYDTMLAKIDAAMAAGQYEFAVIQWLQTQQEQKFFRQYFIKYNPDFVQDLSPLLLLSLGATISMELTDGLLPQRCTWLEAVILAFQALVSSGTLDQQVLELIPKIMGIYVSRIEHLFMHVSQSMGTDPILKRLSGIVLLTNRIMETSGHSLAAQAA